MPGYVFYILLVLSILINLLLFLRVRYLKKELKKLRGGVELSKEELEQLRNRLTRIRHLEDKNQFQLVFLALFKFY